MKEEERIILGIDPGTTIMGYGVIRACGKQAEAVTLGIIELSKFSDHYLKLQQIYKRVHGLVEAYHPDEMAIEAPFYGKNVQSMLKLGRAQGVAMAAALSHDIPIFEYAPRKIKMAITGSGSASKGQVAYLLQQILKLQTLPTNHDATDGLAAALCHFYQQQRPGASGGYKSWNDFINKNPGRTRK